ncbi:MAG: branched-chain amino acid ABC transporter permease [Candidatus Paceibacterota bacterium]|jgi:branched-subunit amino acid ABC-type transport system permease component
MIVQLLIYSFIAGTQVLILALGLFTIYSVSKVQHLALGGIAAAVAYAFYFASHDAALPLWGLIAVPLLVAILLGIISFWLNESFTKRQEYLLALLVSFSFGVALEAIISIVFGTDGKSLISGVSSVVSYGDYQIPLSGIFIIGFGAICALISLFVVKFTSFGRTLKAIAENSFSATSIGINERKIRLIIYIAVCIVAGGIGILSGLNTALTPMMGFNLIIMAFIALLVGGVTDVRGTIIASYIVALVPEFIVGIVPNISSNWKMVLVFLIAFVVLIVKPEGLIANKQRKA